MRWVRKAAEGAGRCKLGCDAIAKPTPEPGERLERRAEAQRLFEEKLHKKA